jgi:hypothetical protein
LLRQWPRLVLWIEQAKPSIRMLQGVERAAEDFARVNTTSPKRVSRRFLQHSGDRLRQAFVLTKKTEWKRRLGSTGMAYLTACRRHYRARLRYQIVGAVVLVVVVASVAITAATRVPHWPTNFDEVRSADMQPSQIDDQMVVKVNGHEVINVGFGAVPSRVNVMPFLIRGPNKIEVEVLNGDYGGCQGRLKVRLNGIESKDFDWYWGKDKAAPRAVCATDVRTLNLD